MVCFRRKKAPSTAGKVLDSSANNFERGSVDVFKIDCSDLGPVHKLLVDSDGSGLSSDWHLAQISINNVKLSTLTTFVFNDWISTKNGLQRVCSSSMFSYSKEVHLISSPSFPEV